MVIFIAGLQYAGISDRYMLCTSYTEHQVHKEWYFFKGLCAWLTILVNLQAASFSEYEEFQLGTKWKQLKSLIPSTTCHALYFFRRKIKDKK